MEKIGNMRYDELFSYTFKALRHRLGRSRDGGVIFWQIDTLDTVYDGKIMHYLWLAAGGLYELTAVKLFPLRGRRIILFPDTDPDGKAYALWYRVMTEARRLLGQPVAISPLLELQATPAQKAAKIDLADYWFEASKRGV